jgi:hypothetical protein
MTYQEIVNRIQSIVEQHWMLASFGYGDLSDLKARFENTSDDQQVQADYPYLFLNPGTHNRTLNSMTYNFNMLVMDMARGEVSDQPFNNILAIQSQCQQYIDDVLAQLYYGYQDSPEVIRTNIQYVPFNERFQDDVAGMTAQLTIEVPTPLNDCIAPFKQWEEIFYSEPLGAYDYNFGQLLDWYIPEPFTTYKVEWNLGLIVTAPVPTGTTPPYDEFYFTAWQGTGAPPKYIVQDSISNTSFSSAIGETIISLQDIPPDDNSLYMGFGFNPNDVYPGTNETPVNVPNVIGINSGYIKISKLV